jgi:anti-sigma factor RsiW
MAGECRETVDRLAPYVDNLLPAEERTAVERHLTVCPPCRRAALAEKSARTVLREKSGALRSDAIPAGLRSRCEAVAREHWRRAEPRRWTSGLVPIAVTTILIVVTAGIVLSVATSRSNVVLAAQLTADHAKCFRLFATATAAAPDARQLEVMLLNRYGWDVHVPPSSTADGVQLIGARRCLYADGRLPHVMYRVNGQDVSLYMLPGVSRNDADVSSLGHRSRIWSRGNTTYVLVSSLAGRGLDNAVRYVMREARGN